MSEKVNLLDLSLEELQDLFAEMNSEKFRAKQVFQWLHKGIEHVDDMTNISKQLRNQLLEKAEIKKIKIVKRFISQLDGTVKYLFELQDGNIIESVLMRYKHGLTVCISSQVGCRMGCKFCASTGVGYIRNLSAGEMLDQVLTIQKDAGERISNIVIMGIGEPLDNYDNLIRFLKLVNHPDGINIGLRHISVSTCGVVPKIIELSRENLPITLSISLHAANDKTRSEIMPVNNKYSIDKLIEACKIYTQATKRRITFEYALISEVNDKPEQAKELAKLLKGMLCHVNLIPVNTVKGTGYVKSKRERIDKFKSILEGYGIETTVRRELGSDINASCGQLRRDVVSNSINKM